jgi:RimJ/RimL family protein N-acetyltransferase
MVHITRYAEHFKSQVLELSVTPEQVRFVGTTQQLLEEQESGWHYHLFLDDNRVVGFFNIDTEYGSRYDFAEPNELGLRAFLVGHQYQGKGYATQMLSQLPAWLSEHFSQSKSICLTVNKKNQAAKLLYLKAGFVDTGELYLDGSAGPQHILRREL